MNVHAKEDPEKLFFSVSLFSFVNRQKSFSASTVFMSSSKPKRLGGQEQKEKHAAIVLKCICNTILFHLGPW